MNKRAAEFLPRYKGRRWIKAELPDHAQDWVDGKKKSLRQRGVGHKQACENLDGLIRQHIWHWPKQRVYFITDIHADADALIASLVASGSIEKNGSKDKDFRLTKTARRSRYVIGGDCFDKGPSSLRLLRMLKRLYKRGANLRLLAGNHDIRIMLGMRSVGHYRDLYNQHFFVRMGPKSIPLIQEINAQYIDKQTLKHAPSSKKCRELLYPSPEWFNQFPKIAQDWISAPNIRRELDKIAKKVEHFEVLCEQSQLTLQQVYAATLYWQRLFLQPGGEFAWFYNRMRLFYRQGAFLFIHAGLDDKVASMIHKKGVKHVNRQFRKHLFDNQMAFYYGSIANSIRTKYRAADHPLSKRGARLMHEMGIHAIVHGHRNLYHGQRIALRKSLINFECDTTMDSGSRIKEKLDGAGAGVTVIRPEKAILGISTDHKFVKVFNPHSAGKLGG